MRSDSFLAQISYFLTRFNQLDKHTIFNWSAQTNKRYPAGTGLIILYCIEKKTFSLSCSKHSDCDSTAWDNEEEYEEYETLACDTLGTKLIHHEACSLPPSRPINENGTGVADNHL